MKLQNTTDFSGCRLKTQIDAKKTTFDLFLLIELKKRLCTGTLHRIIKTRVGAI